MALVPDFPDAPTRRTPAEARADEEVRSPREPNEASKNHRFKT